MLHTTVPRPLLCSFFFPVSKQHTTGIFTHPGLSITISKGGAADSSDNETPPPTTGGSTPATKTTTVGGGQEPDQGGGVRIVMESGRPTVVGPDGRRVVVPPGQVVYIRPPSGRNGSPGTQGAMIASVWHGNLSTLHII